MSEKKENVLCTRVDDITFKYLKKYSQNYNISNSKLIRKAIRYYLKYAHKDDKNISYIPPKILITKEDFKFIINRLNEKELEQLAEKSYKNALNGIQGYFLIVYNEEIDPLEIKPRALLRILNNNIFQYDGQNWFNSIKFVFNKDILTVGGNHYFSKNFSIYFKYFILKFLKPYSFKLIYENLEENKIILKLKKE